MTVAGGAAAVAVVAVHGPRTGGGRRPHRAYVRPPHVRQTRRARPGTPHHDPGCVFVSRPVSGPATSLSTPLYLTHASSTSLSRSLPTLLSPLGSSRRWTATGSTRCICPWRPTWTTSSSPSWNTLVHTEYIYAPAPRPPSLVLLCTTPSPPSPAIPRPSSAFIGVSNDAASLPHLTSLLIATCYPTAPRGVIPCCCDRSGGPRQGAHPRQRTRRLQVPLPRARGRESRARGHALGARHPAQVRASHEAIDRRGKQRGGGGGGQRLRLLYPHIPPH